MNAKPRIKLVRRAPVFAAKKWRCFGFAPDGKRYGVGYGWNPADAYYNWHIDLMATY